MMKAVVLEAPGGVEQLQIKQIPLPKVKPGWVLIQVKAFGINRSEVMTRQGHSPSVQLPRVLGIECVGVVADRSDSTRLQNGQPVVSLMGGLGREFDGGYARYTLVPEAQVYSVGLPLDWITLAAIPETFVTAYGSLFSSLKLVSQDSLLIRGATSSVGLAAIQLAKTVGATVLATTRSSAKVGLLNDAGANYVLVDGESFVDGVLAVSKGGVNKILELVCVSTLDTSLQVLKQGGIVCVTGILGGWTLKDFQPMSVKAGTYLTSYHSDAAGEVIDELFAHIGKHDIKPRVAKVFGLNQIQEAHAYMESNQANGKIVVTTE
eukprot:Blabericola_migrator_1__10594@NODE_601_length_7399_cov_48_594790_g438_i0_p4_GENE_NODE_601_length_7399_cov_48_594790_g438_i0NODE_601_length_7399_cov_48_594790_g438_i0_p4_ORF_typecomplete_len321_score54_99ADH_zinc_N_2/PF13602_6/7_5e17ADH_zinc_N/PF00107_26/4_3e03ADH_zinc_N/PF00107_26/3e15ADH_N/PF08240_12/9_7e13Glu_dehyd_C/PF16912_5/4_6e03Glu_dehyd_C/PF16912_5/5_1e06ADH_N_2/PF16884_5/0_047_NODE_601_length_7399_cov_48_594790_g438_i017882750